MQGRKMFEVYSDNVKNIKHRYYLVTPLSNTAHESMYGI